MPSSEPIEYDRLPLTVAAYCELRRLVGWHAIADERAERALSASVLIATASIGERIVGCGRVVGDGAVYFYVQDVLVAPDFQKRGLGSALVSRLMDRIGELAPAHSGAFLGLMVAPGLEDFYSRFGFRRLPANSPFLGQWRNGH